MFSRAASARFQVRWQDLTIHTAQWPLAARACRRDLSTQQLDQQKNGRERIVVLGSGWAGYGLGHDLNKKKYQVVIISPRSYFVFTPLLASTSVGTLEFRTALESVRATLRKAYFMQGWADEVDFENKTLTVEEAVDDPAQGQALARDRHKNFTQAQRAQEKQSKTKMGELFQLKYDKLAIAVGCYAQTFDTRGVRENAFFLKDVGDARRIRNRLLTCFELAALPTTTDETKKMLLHFAVVGGGPTGIEFAAEMHDLINEDMKKLYPEHVKYARITVFDVAPTVLSMFDEKLANFAMKTFQRQGIEIKTSRHVRELRVGAPSSLSGDQHIEDTMYTIQLQEEGDVGVGMCVWSTGLMMNPFVEKALAGKVKRDSKSGALLTNGRLQVLNEDGHAIPDVYGVGDCAAMENAAYPATAQVASQKASWLAKRLNKGDLMQQEFTWKNMGIMAYVGNWNAILQSGGGGDISGRVAWFLWRSAYLVKSVSWRNRILIPVYWFINFVFGRDISRF